MLFSLLFIKSIYLSYHFFNWLYQIKMHNKGIKNLPELKSVFVEKYKNLGAFRYLQFFFKKKIVFKKLQIL